MLQELNIAQQGHKPDSHARFKERLNEAIGHGKFSCLLYRLHMREGRYWVHEHPLASRAWRLPELVNAGLGKLHLSAMDLATWDWLRSQQVVLRTAGASQGSWINVAKEVTLMYHSQGGSSQGSNLSRCVVRSILQGDSKTTDPRCNLQDLGTVHELKDQGRQDQRRCWVCATRFAIYVGGRARQEGFPVEHGTCIWKAPRLSEDGHLRTLQARRDGLPPNADADGLVGRRQVGDTPVTKSWNSGCATSDPIIGSVAGAPPHTGETCRCKSIEQANLRIAAESKPMSWTDLVHEADGGDDDVGPRPQNGQDILVE